jgi:phosphoribosylformylglycinamidine synthase
VPQRETGMTSYEIMLSESQERMLLVAEKGREAEVIAVFTKWGLDCAEVGTVTADDVMRVYHHGMLEAEIPNKALTDEAPVYHRPVGVWNPPVPKDPPVWVLEELKKPRDYTADLKKLLASPNICSKHWIYEQYDSMVQTNTVQGPGGEAGVIRIKPYESGAPLIAALGDEWEQTPAGAPFIAAPGDEWEQTPARLERGLAMALAGNGRWCYLDPKLGAMHAVAEAARKVACTGATPVAATNCLNFGNPEKPEIMAQLALAIDGIAEACTALGTPVTGGNVSLYNETKGEGIYPTPVIGIVGILDDVTKAVPSAFQRTGDAICVLFPEYSEFTFPPIDPTRKDLGQLRKELAQQEAEMEHAHLRRFGSSEYAKVLYRELWGDVPTIDLEASARCNQVLQELASLRLLNSAADEGSGGSIVTITRCALPNNIGAELGWFYEPPGPLELLPLFREDVNHVVITCSPEDVGRIDAITRVRGIGCQQIGTTIPDEIKVGFGEDVPLVWQLGDLRRSSEDALAEQLAQEVIA